MRKPIVLAIAALALAGCTSANPAPDSDSTFTYDNATIPVDEHVYTVTGEVADRVNSVTRQVAPATGSSSSYYNNGFGVGSGSYFGPIEAGKGYLRLLVQHSDTDEATVGTLVVLKVSDTKATALVPGDVVTLRCRRQYENIAAVRNGQSLDERGAGTWELDYCRLLTPEVNVTGKAVAP